MDSPEIKSVLNMTAETVGKDILQALVMEIKMLPDVWQKLAQKKQDDILDRLRKCVETNVRMAVHLINSEGRTHCVADLEGVTIKDDIKATFKVARASGYESMQHLFDSVGQSCIIIVAEGRSHMGGMNDIRSDPEQPGLNLGQDEDPEDSDGSGVIDIKGTTIDIEGEVLGLPAPTPEHEGDDADTDPIYGQAARAVIAQQSPSIAFLHRWFRIDSHRAESLILRMEKEGVISVPDANGARIVLMSLDEFDDHMGETED
jgi:hypothetical protein